jgi:hypothetical protein
LFDLLGRRICDLNILIVIAYYFHKPLYNHSIVAYTYNISVDCILYCTSEVTVSNKISIYRTRFFCYFHCIQGYHIGMDSNFGCLWCRHNSQLQKSSYWPLSFCADLLNYEINYSVFKQFYFTYNNFYIINKYFTRSKKIYFAVLEVIYNNVVPHWSAILISCNHSITRLISLTKLEINSFFIWTLCIAGPSLASEHKLL